MRIMPAPPGCGAATKKDFIRSQSVRSSAFSTAPSGVPVLTGGFTGLAGRSSFPVSAGAPMNTSSPSFGSGMPYFS